MQHINQEYFKKIENYIDYYYFHNGISPTNIEISKGTNLSTATISRYISKLCGQGILESKGHRNIKTKKMQNEKTTFIRIPMILTMGNKDKDKEGISIETEYMGNGVYFLFENG